LELLKILWELGEGSVRDVNDRLAERREAAFNTVQTQLRNMEEKGLVTHRAEGRTFIYRPLYSREQMSSRLLHKVFDGALDQLVLSMLRAKDASDAELEQLERLIAEARERKQSERKRKGGK
jgi:predicted transcriptional regulator